MHDAELTKRQQQIVDLVRVGLSNKQIARELGIRDTTVKVHLQQVFQRLGLHNRREVMLKFLTQPPVGYNGWPTSHSDLTSV